MEKTKMDATTGKITVTFTDDDGEVFSTFRISPTDSGVAKRCEDVSIYFESNKDRKLNTVRRIIKGLNNAGFSDKDYRISDSVVPKPIVPNPIQLHISDLEPKQEENNTQDEFEDVDGKEIAEELERRRQASQNPENAPKSDSMLAEAEKAGEAYNHAIKSTQDPFTQDLPLEVRDKVTTFIVKPEFRQDIENITIPQFFQTVPESLFSEGLLVLLEKEQLAEGFTLKGKAYDIDFGTADDEIAKVDVQDSEGSLPKVFKMSNADQRYFKEYFNSLPPESRVRQCKDMLKNQLNKMNMVDSGELAAYIDRIVDDMDKAQLAAMEKSPMGYAYKIRQKIESLLTEHYRETFKQWLETERIVCQPSYHLPASIHPMSSTNMYGRSLYQAEEDMNRLEQDLILELTALPNVRWWHRNMSRTGFCINGFVNHYPDIMVMTNSGKLILVETKGEHLKNDDSRDKIELGKAWRNAAGKQYRYYMVFREEDNLPAGAVSMSEFVEIIKKL